jgi:hypothetical protein
MAYVPSCPSTGSLPSFELRELGPGGTAAWSLARLAMAVTYVDQVMAFLALGANRTAFIDAIGLAAFAGASFTRRYGSSGFQVDSVSLDAPGDFRIQQLVQDDLRITGYSEKRLERPERKWIDYRVRKQQVIGWIDAAFITQTTLALHAVPGSAVLGPQAGVEQAGTQSAPLPMTWRSNFLLGLTTDQFSLGYPLQVNVFTAPALSPTDDLRRILAVRNFLEADPAFLVSLDGSPDQRPLLFVQVYPAGAADGGPLSPAAIVQLFDEADVLAAFFALPA